VQDAWWERTRGAGEQQGAGVEVVVEGKQEGRKRETGRMIISAGNRLHCGGERQYRPREGGAAAATRRLPTAGHHGDAPEEVVLRKGLFILCKQLKATERTRPRTGAVARRDVDGHRPHAKRLGTATFRRCSETPEWA
jgi:hypothetical protein